jgi:magnesium transporter
MIRVLLRHPDGSHEFGDETILSRWDPAAGVLAWVDIDRHDDASARALLTGRFGIDALAVSDALRERHPPKIEWFDNCLFLLVKGFTAETADINFSVVHISLFVGRGFLLTVHRLASPSVDAILADPAAAAQALGTGPSHLAYRVLRRVVDRYAPVILGLEQRLDALEEEIAERPGDALLIELQRYVIRLRKLRRTFGYQQACFAELLHTQSPLLHARASHEFQDLFEHMERMASLSTLLQELARDLLEGHISLSGHRLNSIMKALTIASVIFLPLTFLAGIYGMNFENMPELHAEDGYYLLLGGMGVIAAALLWGFRRARWL